MRSLPDFRPRSLRPLLALALSAFLASCEIRIGGGGHSGIFFNSFSMESDGEDGESVFLRGKGSYSFHNGRLGKLGDGSRVYFLRAAGKPEESEVVAMRQGETLETAVLRQGMVGPLSAADREWLEAKLNTSGLDIVAAPGIDEENQRINGRRDLLSQPAIDWKLTDATLQESMFPWAVLPEILAAAKREKIGAEDEKGLLGLIDRETPLFRHRDRDRIVEALVGREDLSAGGIASILASLDEVGYAKRSEISLKLVARPAFDAQAAHRLLESIDDVPHDGRAEVLAALRHRGEICPEEEWLDAVLEQAPYDRRARLILDALAVPAGAARSSGLARATLSRLDDFPYDRRTAIFTQCVQAGFDKDDVAKLVDRVFDDIPYNERQRTLETMTEDPTLGVFVVREVIRRVDDLPLNSRDDFLIAAAKRSDLTANDQVRIVRQTLEDVSYNSRAKVLKALLANPLCSAEAKETIWRHRKNLPAGQREEIEELFPEMKTHALGLLFLLGGCVTTYTQPSFITVSESATDPSVEILSVIHEQEQAWNRGDIEGYMQGYAKQAGTTFASGNDLTRGWQETLERYQKGYDSKEKMGKLEFAELKVESISSDAAIVTGRWALAREKDRPHGLFTLIFRLLPEGWRIVHDHTSAAKS